MKTLLGAENLTTTTDLQWQNEPCEENHQMIDSMLEVMERDHPERPIETLLGWACMVKNTMYDLHGRTPYQIATRRVFSTKKIWKKVGQTPRGKIRTNNEVYHRGDKVRWKDAHEDRWRGPGIVQFQDEGIVGRVRGFQKSFYDFFAG